MTYIEALKLVRDYSKENYSDLFSAVARVQENLISAGEPVDTKVFEKIKSNILNRLIF